eukprot:GHVT01064850.1.p1 GENE.GHVT01064850.1~~GHVT01064850.1.p1  ORF type:complete len:365 (-),score=-3.14 GHVT01064850.1:87-1181(-)
MHILQASIAVPIPSTSRLLNTYRTLGTIGFTSRQWTIRILYSAQSTPSTSVVKFQSTVDGALPHIAARDLEGRSSIRIVSTLRRFCKRWLESCCSVSSRNNIYAQRSLLSTSLNQTIICHSPIGVSFGRSFAAVALAHFVGARQRTAPSFSQLTRSTLGSLPNWHCSLPYWTCRRQTHTTRNDSREPASLLLASSSAKSNHAYGRFDGGGLDIGVGRFPLDELPNGVHRVTMSSTDRTQPSIEIVICPILHSCAWGSTGTNTKNTFSPGTSEFAASLVDLLRPNILFLEVCEERLQKLSQAIALGTPVRHLGVRSLSLLSKIHAGMPVFASKLNSTAELNRSPYHRTKRAQTTRVYSPRIVIDQ